MGGHLSRGYPDFGLPQKFAEINLYSDSRKGLGEFRDSTKKCEAKIGIYYACPSPTLILTYWDKKKPLLGLVLHQQPRDGLRGGVYSCGKFRDERGLYGCLVRSRPLEGDWGKRTDCESYRIGYRGDRKGNCIHLLGFC